MAPTLFSKLPILNTPVDFGKRFRGKPILGSHKTYRGFVAGILSAIIAVYIQKLLFQHANLDLGLINYSVVNVWKLGFLLGFGALLGDAVKSFIKRRLNIPSGKPWPPYDQLDWIIGAVVMAGFYVHFQTEHVVTAIILFGLLHPLVNLVGYSLKLKPNKF